MNEHGFVQAVHRRLPPAVYKLKLNVRYNNGVPDAWYSGPAGDVWVEYKYRKDTPKRAFTVSLSKLQLNWLTAREAEGRNVVVVVGSPGGALILRPSQCQDKIQVFDSFLTTDGVASWITRTTT